MNTLSPGQSLVAGGALTSSNGRAQVVMQPDGNLVMYDLSGGPPPAKPLWASGTAGKGGVVAAMQADGNLVVYNAQRTPLWASATQGNPGAYAIIQDDGNFVVYLGTAPKWASATQDFTKHEQGGFNFLTSVQDALKAAVQVGNIIGFAGINLNTALFTGQNPIDALKADVTNFQKSASLAQLVLDGNYKSAWAVATNNGQIFSPDLPPPQGLAYAPNATPNSDGAQSANPVVAAAKRTISIPLIKTVSESFAHTPTAYAPPSSAVVPSFWRQALPFAPASVGAVLYPVAGPLGLVAGALASGLWYLFSKKG